MRELPPLPWIQIERRMQIADNQGLYDDTQTIDALHLFGPPLRL